MGKNERDEKGSGDNEVREERGEVDRWVDMPMGLSPAPLAVRKRERNTNRRLHQ